MHLNTDTDGIVLQPYDRNTTAMVNKLCQTDRQMFGYV